MILADALLLGFLSPESLIEKGGLVLLAGMVFAESGLLVGFFLPGDSLLFIAGVMTAANAGVLPSIWVVIAVVAFSAIAGDQVGYMFGRRVGPALRSRPRSRWFKPEHLSRAETFFEHHGAKAIVLARFVPVARTFTPIVAGVGKMRYPTFVAYNFAGGALWGGGVTLLGFFFGDTRIVQQNFELANLAVIGLSLLPIVAEYVRHHRSPDVSATETIATETITTIDGRVTIDVGHVGEGHE